MRLYMRKKIRRKITLLVKIRALHYNEINDGFFYPRLYLALGQT